MTSNENYTVFRECLSSAIVARSGDKPKTVKRRQKPKRNGRKDETTSSEIATKYTRADPEELAEFIDVNSPTREPKTPSPKVAEYTNNS